MSTNTNIENTEFPINAGVELSSQQRTLVGSVLDLFAGKPSLEKLQLWKDDAVFEDPITIARGREQFEPQWYGLKAAFSEIERLKCSVTKGGNPTIFEMETRYKVKGLGKDTTIASEVHIAYDEASGKITKVEDRWNGKLPDGSIQNAFRRLNAVSVPKMVGVPKED